ncbi:MAG: Hsp20/alpha crystallin family protein [Acidobacteriaceae bacterium]|nr:Hsp20/alpha crystallin family protein [Acidobacteriaceae bacterium]
MPITRHNPFAELEDFPTGLRLFQDTVNRFLSEPSSRPWTPPCDIYETENDLVVKCDLPEVDSKNVEIKIENGNLSIRGERQFSSNSSQKGFHRIERSYGNFVRYFTLPETVDAEKVSAKFENGVLTVTLPKKEVAKPRTIQVQVGNNN